MIRTTLWLEVIISICHMHIERKARKTSMIYGRKMLKERLGRRRRNEWILYMVLLTMRMDVNCGAKLVQFVGEI